MRCRDQLIYFVSKLRHAPRYITNPPYFGTIGAQYHYRRELFDVIFDCKIPILPGCPDYNTARKIDSRAFTLQQVRVMS